MGDASEPFDLSFQFSEKAVRLFERVAPWSLNGDFELALIVRRDEVLAQAVKEGDGPERDHDAGPDDRPSMS